MSTRRLAPAGAAGPAVWVLVVIALTALELLALRLVATTAPTTASAVA